MGTRHTNALLISVLGLLFVALGVTGCGSGSSVPEPQVPKETTQTAVFFATGRSLVEETRVVDAARVYDATLTELLAAKPVANPDIAIVQPDAKVNSVTVKNGVATIDWSPEVLAFKAEDKEKFLAWAAVMTTMGQFSEIQKVRFTVNGKTDGKISNRDVAYFWGKIGLKGQPWNVVRPPDYAGPGAGKEATATVGLTITTTPKGTTTTTNK